MRRAMSISSWRNWSRSSGVMRRRVATRAIGQALRHSGGRGAAGAAVGKPRSVTSTAYPSAVEVIASPLVDYTHEGRLLCSIVYVLYVYISGLSQDAPTRLPPVDRRSGVRIRGGRGGC